MIWATLLEIRNKYPRCRTFGVDINRAAINIASHIAEVQYCDIEKLCLPFDEKFDYIIFGDVLEHLRNPEEVLRMCHTVLTEDGCIMASIPNIMHISVLEELIHGRFIYTDQGLLDRTHIHFFTYYEIMDMFQRAGYVVESVKNMVLPISEKQQEMKMKIACCYQRLQEVLHYQCYYVQKKRLKEIIQVVQGK